MSWPTVFQLFAPTGEVLSTRLLQPSTPLPEYTRAGAGESASIVDKLVEETSSRRLSKPLFAIAAGTIMASAALYGTSALSAKRYWGEEDSENWDRYRLQTNGLFVASTATAAVGITVGAWALITVEF